MSKRTEMIGSTIQKALSEIVLSDLKMPELGFITFTRVEVSSDLSIAKVFVSVLADSDDIDSTIRMLTAAAGKIKHHLSKRIRLRHMPRLKFLSDKSAAEYHKIEEIIQNIEYSAEETED